MQILISPVSTGLHQEEKYQSIPRDRWGKWREHLQEKTEKKADSPKIPPADNPEKPQVSGVSVAAPLTFSPAHDKQVDLLFSATLLRTR